MFRVQRFCRLRLFAGLLLVTVPGCRGGELPEIRIGLLATFTGPYADVSGTPTRDGARLALSGLHDLEVGGKHYRITLVEHDFDDRGDAAAAAARALINQQQVVALIGPQFSRHAIPVAVLAEAAHVPMISPMSSALATTSGRRFVFRLAFLDDVQGDVLARFAIEDLNAKTGAVFYDVSTTYSRGLAERFRDAFTAHGGRMVAFESYTADRVQDVGRQLARIKAGRPDVLFMPNFPDAISAHLPLIRRLGLHAKLLGADSWDPASLAPPPAESIFVTNQWRPDIPTDSARHFVELFRRTYGTEPRATAALTYDAVRILLAAIQRAGSLDPAAIRDAIAATRSYTGAGGMVSFAGAADPLRSVAVSAVRGGTLHTLRLIEP